VLAGGEFTCAASISERYNGARHGLQTHSFHYDWARSSCVETISGYAQTKTQAGRDEDRAALEKTSMKIRAAFARGDVNAIMSYHHPDVVKSLSYQNFLTGRDEVRKDVTATLEKFHLEWTENQVRSLMIQGDVAVEMTDFTIKGTPRGEGRQFLFAGRAMVVYVRYKASPTGWASIREVVQPAP